MDIENWIKTVFLKLCQNLEIIQFKSPFLPVYNSELFSESEKKSFFNLYHLILQKSLTKSEKKLGVRSVKGNAQSYFYKVAWFKCGKAEGVKNWWALWEGKCKFNQFSRHPKAGHQNTKNIW